MGDRVRVGEVLAAIGAIGLAFLLAFGAWYDYESQPVRAGGDLYVLSGAVGSRYLGWFALLTAAASAASGLVFLARVITSRTTERPMLQAPVAYAFSAFALLVVGLRLILGDPKVTLQASSLASDLRDSGLESLPLETSVALGGWLGLAAIWLIVVGLWIAMSDDRVHAKGPKARTAALLSTVTTRPAPPAGNGGPDADASVVADDALPSEDDLPFNPSIRPSGGPA